EAGAARTAAVAQSVIEESAVLQSVDGQLITPFTDDALVWISQVLGQDVNIFDGPRLVATSERDIYASGLLPTRTPDMVYRAIALEQLPSFVGQDAIGALRYQLAAAPIRAGGRDAILTVPLASRQQEIESQIDELNRRVSGSALFVAAVVGFIGWAIARSIADPVKRLTRATSRVARYEYQAPVSARRAELLKKRVADLSADELEVLEADFNKMAVELDAQRRQLERTHRLEAWTEMARQVAHEIKNPLTPVQLSAEHLLRVHSDRGSPLSPVLQGCVDSILKQVRILRQIASEFSSYASSPVADPEPTSLADLIDDIIAPYRPGLEGRIELSVDVAPDLPSLRLDRRLIQRALTNIIENALHAMPDGGTLSIRLLLHADQMRLVVADTGVGLEADVLARIFEPYFSTKVTGTGLGMAIAKRNVELNGGTIEVTSEPGEGTTVTLTLPLPAETSEIGSD
ncbi:MAG: ATP-binding protein, partial [Vicinamibacterales bacterium]|nr:ATP-binding protein [Vicinamibacterales bacterium]